MSVSWRQYWRTKGDHRWRRPGRAGCRGLIRLRRGRTKSGIIYLKTGVEAHAGEVGPADDANIGIVRGTRVLRLIFPRDLPAIHAKLRELVDKGALMHDDFLLARSQKQQAGNEAKAFHGDDSLKAVLRTAELPTA